jgi:hypothetical protein
MEKYIVWGYRDEGGETSTVQLSEHNCFEDAYDAAGEQEASRNWRWVHVERME